MADPTDRQVNDAFKAHVKKLEQQALDGDGDAIRSLACMALLIDGFRYSPDDGGDKVIDLQGYQLAA